MNVMLTKPFVTPEEFLHMQDRNGFELEDGHLVEKNVSLLSSWVGGQCIALLKWHSREQPVGFVMDGEATYQCFPDKPNTVRKPDFSFIRAGRVTYAQFARGHARVAPDLVGEALSPTDTWYEVTERVWQYIQAGTRLVWVVNPQDRTVLIYRVDRSISGLNDEQELTGEDVVPGFRCRVRDLFPPPELLAGLLAETPQGEAS